MAIVARQVLGPLRTDARIGQQINTLGTGTYNLIDYIIIKGTFCLLTAKFSLALDRISVPITALAYMACLEGHSSLNGSNSAWDVT